MKYFLPINLLLFLVLTLGSWISPEQSCSVTETKDSTGLYSINLSIYNNNFSGLLFFKRHSDSTIRTVLTSEMGPKILDMELSPEKYMVNFAIKQLDKKIILNALYTDLGTISGIFDLEKTEMPYNDSLNATHYVLLKQNEISFQWDSVKSCYTAEVFNKKEREMVIYYFCNNSGRMADSIILQHFNFKMNILLKKIDY